MVVGAGQVPRGLAGQLLLHGSGGRRLVLLLMLLRLLGREVRLLELGVVQIQLLHLIVQRSFGMRSVEHVIATSGGDGDMMFGGGEGLVELGMGLRGGLVGLRG